MKIKGPSGNCGVIVARFQVPYLSVVHTDIIDSVRVRHPKFLIVLGVAKYIPSRLNPLDFATRAAMIQSQYPGTLILPINDVNSDKIWSNNLDSLLHSVMSTESIVLYGGRDSFTKHYKGKFKTCEFEQEGLISGTEIRTQAFQEIKSSEDFRRGICYAVANQYKRVVPTVDGAVTRGSSVLLGRKPNEHQFRFFGGFVEPGKDYEYHIQRELAEEALAGQLVVKHRIHYIGSWAVDDWRYRETGDEIKTILFHVEYPVGPVKAGDDIEEVKWFDIATLTQSHFVPEHRPLQDMFMDYIREKVGFVK